ncbi:MAG: hypothetical protein FWE50_00110 [Alphaproteobacteria bacterium]|nr:hypothetical protein [Alphaproteobacteria bacterium]
MNKNMLRNIKLAGMMIPLIALSIACDDSKPQKKQPVRNTNNYNQANQAEIQKLADLYQRKWELGNFIDNYGHKNYVKHPEVALSLEYNKRYYEEFSNHISAEERVIIGPEGFRFASTDGFFGKEMYADYGFTPEFLNFIMAQEKAFYRGLDPILGTSKFGKISTDYREFNFEVIRKLQEFDREIDILKGNLTEAEISAALGKGLVERDAKDILAENGITLPYLEADIQDLFKGRKIVVNSGRGNANPGSGKTGPAGDSWKKKIEDRLDKLEGKDTLTWVFDKAGTEFAMVRHGQGNPFHGNAKTTKAWLSKHQKQI